MAPRATLLPNRPISELTLADFASKNSVKFFKISGISPTFLSRDPCTWKSDVDYQKGLSIVQHLKVVNDTAERGVQLIKDFLVKKKLTNDEAQR